MKRFFLIIGMLSLWTSALLAETVFSSHYTPLQKDCKYPEKKSEETEGDVPMVCPSFQNYSVEIGWSATQGCLFITSIQPPQNNSVSVVPQIACDRGTAIVQKTLEWRLADGKAFAVIIRHSIWNEDDPANPKKIRESLVVKGLTGFESLNTLIDTAKNPHANESARAQADAAYQSAKVQSH